MCSRNDRASGGVKIWDGIHDGKSDLDGPRGWRVKRQHEAEWSSSCQMIHFRAVDILHWFDQL